MRVENSRPDAEIDIADCCLECGIVLDPDDSVDFRGDSLCFDCAEDRLLESEYPEEPSAPDGDLARRSPGFQRH